MMIFFLLQYSSCKHVFNMSYYYESVFYFNRIEETEIYVDSNVGTFLSKWDNIDDLFLEVNTIDSKGEIKTYGPFDSGSGLNFILFKTKDYTLNFKYEGLEEVNLTILFSDQFPRHDSRYEDYSMYDSFDDIKWPFLYSFDSADSSGKTCIKAMNAILVIIWIGYLFVGFVIGDDD